LSALAPDTRPAARAAFLASPIWSSPFKDGRSSAAYFELFERLRVMRSQGEILGVLAFQPTHPTPAPQSASAYNIAMARAWSAAVACSSRSSG
jgi:hypothetical protein